MALAINNPSNYISSLVSAGADAMKNLYYIEFVGGGSISNYIDAHNNSLTIRSNDFTPPTVKQSVSNNISYLTTSLSVPTSNIDIDRSFSISFRLDTNYSLYNALKMIQSLTSKPTLGFASTATPHELGADLIINVYSMSNVVVADSSLTMDSNHNAYFGEDSDRKLLYSFKQCWIDKVTLDGAYSYGSSTTKTVTANFHFAEFETPMTTLF